MDGVTVSWSNVSSTSAAHKVQGFTRSCFAVIYQQEQFYQRHRYLGLRGRLQCIHGYRFTYPGGMEG